MEFCQQRSYLVCLITRPSAEEVKQNENAETNMKYRSSQKTNYGRWVEATYSSKGHGERCPPRAKMDAQTKSRRLDKNWKKRKRSDGCGKPHRNDFGCPSSKCKNDVKVAQAYVTIEESKVEKQKLPMTKSWGCSSTGKSGYCSGIFGRCSTKWIKPSPSTISNGKNASNQALLEQSQVEQLISRISGATFATLQASQQTGSDTVAQIENDIQLAQRVWQDLKAVIATKEAELAARPETPRPAASSVESSDGEGYFATLSWQWHWRQCCATKVALKAWSWRRRLNSWRVWIP